MRLGDFVMDIENTNFRGPLVGIQLNGALTVYEIKCRNGEKDVYFSYSCVPVTGDDLDVGELKKKLGQQVLLSSGEKGRLHCVRVRIPLADGRWLPEYHVEMGRGDFKTFDCLGNPPSYRVGDIVEFEGEGWSITEIDNVLTLWRPGCTLRYANTESDMKIIRPWLVKGDRVKVCGRAGVGVVMKASDYGAPCDIRFEGYDARAYTYDAITRLDGDK